MSNDQKQQLEIYQAAIRSGQILKANEAAISLYKSSNTKIDQPVADAFTLKGYLLAYYGQSDKAINLFRQALWLRPDNRYAAEGLALALEDSFAKQSPKEIPGRIVIGLGTGRSGSSSLTKLLNEQNNSRFAHEYPPKMGWEKGHDRLSMHTRRFDIMRQHLDFVGDVAHWWLPYADEMIQLDSSIRFVAMRRNKEATIKSFLNVKGFKGKTEPGAINHWVRHDGTFYDLNIWDDAYPEYEAIDLPDALSKYWEDYYATCEKLQKKYPENFRVFKTEEIDSSKCQSEILKFCGFSDGVEVENLHLNKAGTIEDGAEMV